MYSLGRGGAPRSAVAHLVPGGTPRSGWRTSFRGGTPPVPGLLVRILSKQTLSTPLSRTGGQGQVKSECHAPGRARPPGGPRAGGAAGSGRDGDERLDGRLDRAAGRLNRDAEDVAPEHAGDEHRPGPAVVQGQQAFRPDLVAVRADP